MLQICQSVQLFICVRLFATPWIVARQASLSITSSQSLIKLMSIESVMPSNHLILYCPLLLLPSIFASIRVFPSESALPIRGPRSWSFSFSLPMNIQDWFSLGLTGLISLWSKGLSRIFSNTTVHFFIVQLSHAYVTTGKTRALTRRTFVGKVMSLLFNMLSRFVITFLPRSKCILISWLQSPSTINLVPNKIKSVTVSIVSPSICHKVMDQMSWSSFFEWWVLSQLLYSPLSPSSRGSSVPV